MPPRRAAVVALFLGLLSMPGLGCSSNLSLVVIFPDDATESVVASVEIFAIPGDLGSTCVQLLAGLGSPAALAMHSETFPNPPAGGIRFPRLEFGTWVFFAEASTGTGAVVANGCSEQAIERSSSGEIALLLVNTGPLPIDSGFDALVADGGPGVDSSVVGVDSAVMGTDSVPGVDSTVPGTDSTVMGTDSTVVGTDSAVLGPCGTNAGTLDYCSTSNPPNVNGNLMGAEWSMAATCVAMFPSGGLVTLYGMTTATTVYIAADVEDPTGQVNDRLVVVVDLNDNFGDPDAFDRGFRVTRNDTGDTFLGTGTNSDGLFWMVPVAPVFTFGVSTSAPGWTMEMALPKSELGSPPSGSLVHMAIGVRDFDTNELASCPLGLNDLDLSTWAYSIIE